MLKKKKQLGAAREESELGDNFLTFSFRPTKNNNDNKSTEGRQAHI